MADADIADARENTWRQKTPAQAIADRNQEIADEKAEAKESKKIMDRYDNIKKRQAAAGNMGFRLNRRDQELVAGVEEEQARQAVAGQMLKDAQADKQKAEDRLEAARAEEKKLQTDQLAELKKIREKIIESLTVRS